MEIASSAALPRIVLFDDDEANLRLYSNYFKNNFKVQGVQNPHLFSSALKDDVAAIIIDVLMPVMDGLRLYEEVSKHNDYNGCPLIFISSSGSDDVLRTALKSGCHDFLSRSMTRDEMILRISNKINFFEANRSIYMLGSIKLNTSELRAVYRGEILELTLTEIKIMKFLIREFPRLATREEINQEVWPGMTVLPTTLNTHLSNLRSKFPGWEYDILAVKGKGVHLVPKEV